MREFTSGATRNSLEGKLSYMRALSPAVLRRYVQYLAKHRQTPDGLRAFDNWKKGISQDAYCDSLLRHVWDVWLTQVGNEPGDDIQDLLCAIIFNAQGWLFELIHNDTREEIEKPGEYDVSHDQPKTCGECGYKGIDVPCYECSASDPACDKFVPKETTA